MAKVRDLLRCPWSKKNIPCQQKEKYLLQKNLMHSLKARFIEAWATRASTLAKIKREDLASSPRF
jgi:hypothetical protein